MTAASETKTLPRLKQKRNGGLGVILVKSKVERAEIEAGAVSSLVEEAEKRFRCDENYLSQCHY